MNHAAFLKKLHTEKSVLIQQYQTLYPAVYNIVVDQKSLDNIAHVLYQDGRAFSLDGEKHGIDFREIAQSEIDQTVGKILSSMEAARQKNLWHRLGLDTYQRLFPAHESNLPYFTLDKNDYGIFAYSPLSADKFAFIIPDSFGLFKTGSDGRYFGAYGSDLNSTLGENYFHLEDAKIAAALCDYEPAAVWKFEENRILKRLDQMTHETNARPYIFSQPGREPIVNLPEEAKKYLSPEEIELAKKLVVLQESTGESMESTRTEASEFQFEENTMAEETPTEEIGVQISL